MSARGHLRVVEPAPRKATSWRTDMADLDRRYRAKRSGQSAVEYAAAIEGYRRPTTWKGWALRLIAMCLLIATIAAGGLW